jgi:uncharacterized protein (DUF2132 family)
MTSAPSKDPLHGLTLKMMLEALLAAYGWETLVREIRINCFLSNPSITSSLKFLRRTPWARIKVEDLYLRHLKGDVRKTEPKV